MSPPIKACVICSKKSSLICSKCKIMYYCSKDHQVEHWKLHKQECMPFRLEPYPNRLKPIEIYQAKKNIAEGSLLFATRPLMIFPDIPRNLPQNIRHKMIVCMGCCKEVEDFSVCSRCKWPACNEACQDHPFHTRLECTVLANRKVGEQSYAFDDTAIPYNRNVILRALLMKDIYPDKWKSFINLKYDISLVFNTDMKLQQLELTNKFVRKECKQTQFTNEVIEKVFWTIDQNILVGDRLPSCGFVYTMGYPIIQSCYNNVVSYNSFKMDDPEANVLEKMERRYYAARKISPGDFLSLPIQDLSCIRISHVRRDTLLKKAGLLCRCAMCSDPTEFGTYVSAIVCQNCRKDPNKNLSPNSGYLILKDPLNYGIRNRSGIWKCNSCPKSMTSVEMQNVVSEFICSVQHGLDSDIANNLIRICVHINTQAFNQKRELSESEMENIDTAMKDFVEIIRKIDKTESSNTLLHPNHADILCHIRLRQLKLLYLYLSLNTEEDFRTSMWSYEGFQIKLNPSFKFFNQRPHNWIQLNEELRDKSFKILSVYEKVLSHLDEGYGETLFFLSFSGWNILKENARKHRDYEIFLKELKFCISFKHKADACYRNKDADNHSDDPDRVVIFQTLEKMDAVDPSINRDTMSVFNKIIQM